MDKTETLSQTHDALVIGGGPAGLQAALTLGRVHRTVVLVDAGEPRNAPAAHMHNVISHDGAPPAEFRAQARRDLAAYDTVTLLDDLVRSVERNDDGFLARTGSGAELRARRLVLATGMRDELPDVPGLTELWGRLVHHCPFCHGHELAGGRVGILASPKAAHLAGILAPVAEVVVLDDVVKATEEGGRLVAHLGDGTTTTVDGLFVPTELTASAPFAEQLGLTRLDSGGVEVDLLGRTSDPRVFAGGDGAHHRDLPLPMASVLAAAAAGQVAAASCVASLLE
ncbi:NAD(P)/FAD-dependent oxidoreductase [Nocardioides daphniae]|uniref:NAD(P)/FAD-dependent oxidoreductase n=1 Tax=Nocardioides daphniae TaxID=402297 RepID=A0A4P7UA74_9ACTN|nr:NAD(P)/FAD-dependent oxidoreductase [Nocardioides daphniae]QCC76128.1 NAD(P)/FAD-dependent oxidoreductase [Nocardioides daphniae]GGD09818.1 thioredoxin reductase [Nocardioides daphniae]